MFPKARQCFRTSVVFVILVIKIVSSLGQGNQPNSFSGTSVEDQRSSYFFYQQSEHPRDCQEVLGQCSHSSYSGVYLIKPDGYSDPFEVYCDNDVLNGGWTVVERRFGDSINYNRSWEDYESGFGFLSHEHWIGNLRLSYITNQRRYKLRIDVTLTSGSSFYVTYDNFRISDAFGNYVILSTGQYNGTADSVVTWCPDNMVYGTCTCHRTCTDPNSCINSCTETESCVCPSGFLMNDTECIPRNKCSCFIAEADGGRGKILQEGDVYVSPNCGNKCTCTSGQLHCNNSYQCSLNGACVQSVNGSRCLCNPGYEGDGVECERPPVPRDCQDIFTGGETDSGLYDIKPTNWAQDPFQVYCDMTNGGGWTVFQRQRDASENFYRNWDDYKNGFGSADSAGTWLGNDKLYHLTKQGNYTLRIDLTDNSGSQYNANYNLFRINDESDKYRVSAIGTYSGNTGTDSFSWHLNKQFSTHDQDNDGWSSYDCAEQHRGGWWFGHGNRGCYYAHGDYCRSWCAGGEDYCDAFPVGSVCYNCAASLLNGDYDGTVRGRNIFWNNLNGYDCGLQYTEMKIRPVQNTR